jgi:hypothetical protein
MFHRLGELGRGRHHEAQRRVPGRQLLLQIDEPGARDVALRPPAPARLDAIAAGDVGRVEIDRALEHPQIGLAEVRGEPVGRDERIHRAVSRSSRR